MLMLISGFDNRVYMYITYCVQMTENNINIQALLQVQDGKS